MCLEVPRMTSSVQPVPTGSRLFARYAHAPNSLGYCGPENADILDAIAAGRLTDHDVTPIARQFSGAWPYQVTLAELAGIDDPLDAEVTRAYWTGNHLTDEVDRLAFGQALLERIRPHAGHYWSHLDDVLLVEASPTHGFHVLGVYPWSRMLGLGRPEALNVLDSCRIGWARVTAVGENQLEVLTQHLEYAGGILRLGEEHEETVDHKLGSDTFVEGVKAGDDVALHWGFVCDALTATEVESLQRWTHWQLDAMAPRLQAQHDAGR